MMNPSMIRRFTVVLAAMSLAACGDKDSLGPTTAASLDLNAAASQAALGDINSLNGGLGLLGLQQGGTTPITLPSLCAFSTVDQAFDCPTTNVGPFTLRTQYFLYDAANVSQSAVSASTAALRVVNDLTGTSVSSGFTPQITATVNHHSDMKLSGLLATTRTLNGTAVDHEVISSLNGTIASHSTVDLTSTTSNVVFPTTGETRWPSSGSIAADVTTATTVALLPAVTVTGHAVITFNGTNIATVVTTFAGITRTCQVDLTGATAPRCG